ncbi:MAG: hypothetical protein GWP10_05415 [Nitrospiraceae bacterium]|nr:hypothetical protein [Nitrospiraceae bacterium]
MGNCSAERSIYYYTTKNGLEVDFYCLAADSTGQLIQVSADLSNHQTRQREIRAIVKASNELGLNGGLILTLDEENELVEHGKSVKIIPAWKYLWDLW